MQNHVYSGFIYSDCTLNSTITIIANAFTKLILFHLSKFMILKTISKSYLFNIDSDPYPVAKTIYSKQEPQNQNACSILPLLLGHWANHPRNAYPAKIP